LRAICPLISFAFCALIPELASCQQAKQEHQQYRLCLLAATTTSRISNPERDINRVGDLFKHGTDDLKLQYEPMLKSGITDRKQLLGLIEKLLQSADNMTTLVCYLKFHGYTDETGKHVLQLDAKNAQKPEEITNDEIVTFIHNSRQPLHLAVVITDSCSLSSFEPTQYSAAAAVFPKELFNDLFVSASGTVHINSSTYRGDNRVLNQIAWMDEDGSMFTRAINRIFLNTESDQQQHMLEQIGQTNGRFTWKKFVPYLSNETNREFHIFKTTTETGVANGTLQLYPTDLANLKKQDDQFVDAFQLPQE
jgi:hypothetical protein